MPYIYVENLEDGQEEANVFTQEEMEQANSRIAELEEQRDTAIDRAVDAENNYKELKDKYARTFLSKSKEPLNAPKIQSEKIGAQSLEELFGTE